MPAGSTSATCHGHRLPSPCLPPELPATTRPFAPEVFSRGDGLSFWFQQVGANFFASHRHLQAQVAVGYSVRGGDFGWKEDGVKPQERQAGGDLVWFLPGNAEHTLRLRHAAFWIVFYLDPALDAVRDMSVRATLGPFGDYVRRDGLIGDLGAALRRERKADRIENPGHVINLGSLLGSCLLRAHGRETTNGNSVLALPAEVKERIRQFVIEHLREPLSLPVLARVAGIGEDHFSRRLKFSTGLTAEQFILQERLKQAQTQLRTGQHSVEQVADLCGYKNHASLTKQFTVRFGRPPRSFLPRNGRF